MFSAITSTDCGIDCLNIPRTLQWRHLRLPTTLFLDERRSTENRSRDRKIHPGNPPCPLHCPTRASFATCAHDLDGQAPTMDGWMASLPFSDRQHAVDWGMASVNIAQRWTTTGGVMERRHARNTCLRQSIQPALSHEAGPFAPSPRKQENDRESGAWPGRNASLAPCRLPTNQRPLSRPLMEPTWRKAGQWSSFSISSA